MALLATVVLLACALAALATPSTAMASKCGDKILLDWLDNNRIDGVYPQRCYQEAIDAIPADLRDYANVEEVISRALAAVMSGGGNSGGETPPTDGPGGSPDPGDGGNERPADPGSGPSGDNGEVTPAVETSDTSSIPIPLLLLGAMSLALLGAGGLGYLSRRRNAAADGLVDTPADGELGS
jgi:hypothetical protein